MVALLQSQHFAQQITISDNNQCQTAQLIIICRSDNLHDHNRHSSAFHHTNHLMASSLMWNWDRAEAHMWCFVREAQTSSIFSSDGNNISTQWAQWIWSRTRDIRQGCTAIGWWPSPHNAVSSLHLIRGSAGIGWRVGELSRDFLWCPAHAIALERSHCVRCWHLWEEEVAWRGRFGRCLNRQRSLRNPIKYMCSVLYVWNC